MCSYRTCMWSSRVYVRLGLMPMTPAGALDRAEDPLDRLLCDFRRPGTPRGRYRPFTVPHQNAFMVSHPPPRTPHLHSLLKRQLQLLRLDPGPPTQLGYRRLSLVLTRHPTTAPTSSYCCAVNSCLRAQHYPRGSVTTSLCCAAYTEPETRKFCVSPPCSSSGAEDTLSVTRGAENNLDIRAYCGLN